MIGRKIAQYEVTAKIGEGGMGTVYKAHDASLDRIVALKFLKAGTSDAGARKRFIQEAKAASSLDHPNICTIHEIGETDDGHTYIVMPYYDGTPLSDVVARGALAIDDAIDVTRQIASGLAKAHANGIVHRDVKPHNVLITEDGHVKVVDFGLAKLAGATRLTKSGATVGTIVYMSPEQARGEDVDIRSDIFSLGALLYELLTGRVPFNANHDAAIIYSILNSEPPAPGSLRSEIPPDMETVIMRALAKDPSRRYQTLEEMMADLGALGSGSITPPSVRRRPKWSWRVAGIAIAIVVIGAAAVWFTRRAPAPPVAADGKLAVLTFNNHTSDPAFDWMQSGVVEMVTTALSRSPELNVLDTQYAATIVRDYGGDPERGLDPTMLAALAQRAGVTIMLTGSIIKAGDTIRLQARLVDVANGEILDAQIVDGGSEADIFAMVAELVDGVRNYLQIKNEGAKLDQQWMREITTVSVDAYRDMIRGRELFIQQEHERAREYFERAIAADSNFVMAYVDLVGACLNLEDYACIGWAYENALRLRSRASQKEQLYIDVTGAIINGEPDRQISLSEELLALDPTAKFWRYTLGRGHYMSGYSEKAIEIWQPLIDEGYAWVWTYLYSAEASRKLGQFDQGLATLTRGLDVTPEHRINARSRLYRYRGRVNRDAGHIDAARADFDRTVALDPEYAAIVKFDRGILNEQQGNRDEAIRYYTEYLNEDADSNYFDDASARLRRLQSD